MSRKKVLSKWLIVVAFAMLHAGVASAAVTAEEAKLLGNELTLFGAERAGNADGSIPAYTGGVKPPAGWSEESDTYIDPWADEKPLYRIDATNVDQYAAQLTEGAKALIARYPETYYVEVFQTHRSVSYPTWVTDNIAKNATTATLTADGLGLQGGASDGLPFAGTPFPIPKNGNEVLWNHHLHLAPAVFAQTDQSYATDSAGKLAPLPKTDQYVYAPWYDRSGKFRKMVWDAYQGWSSRQVSPPSNAGTFFLNYYLPDGNQKAWFYTPGQRRVRAAPEFAYDVPISAFSGVLMWDELLGLTGRLDRFDYKLLGKREMIIPYNAFKTSVTGKTGSAGAPHHPNPTSQRWEKHRVWVVEATRKPDARHVYARRTYYVDEDCWCIAAFDGYDDAGKLWKTSFVYTFPTYNPEIGGVNHWTQSVHDLSKGVYLYMNVERADGISKAFSSPDAPYLANRLLLTPQAVAAGSVR